jgi:hypothetical protein
MLDPVRGGDGLTAKRTGVTPHRNPHTGLAINAVFNRTRSR